MKGIKPYGRRKDIFRLLLENGPLSISAIEACIYPEMNRKRIYETIKRLRDRRLVVKRQNKTYERGSVYYQITQEPKGLEEVARILGMNAKDLRQPHYRRIELLHSETCAIWKELLRHLFPEARVLREHEFAGDALACSVLIGSEQDFEFRPDLLLFAEPTTGNAPISVGMEIERSHKSRERLIRKLRKYASQSTLDGLIYVCESTELSNRLRDVYQSDIVGDSPRISHYGRNFFLFTDAALRHDANGPEMFNAALEPVSFRKWLNVLCCVPAAARREFQFQTPGA